MREVEMNNLNENTPKTNDRFYLKPIREKQLRMSDTLFQSKFLCILKFILTGEVSGKIDYPT